MRNFENLN